MTQTPKLLMVVSRDFGELSYAMTFARCEGIQATLLLPDNLFQTSDALDGVQSRLYRSLDDVLVAVEHHRPDVVMLFSGYLFALGGLIDLNAVASLVDQFRQRSIPVLTSDPFLGLQFGDPKRPFDIALPNGAAMAQHFIHLANVLSDCTHVYMTPCEGLPSPKKLACGWPPHLMRSASATLRGERLGALSTPLFDGGFWLFVLSNEDFQLQMRLCGEQTFLKLLVARLGDARSAGRTPVLVAPSGCIQALKAFGATHHQALMLSYCAHRQFEDLLLGAGHAFYWNHLSQSLLPRFINKLPTWFFAQGHLLQAIPILRDFVHETYYNGYAVVDFDMRRVLSPDDLDRRAADTLEARSVLARRYETMLQPDALVQKVLAQSPRNIRADAE